MWLVECAFGVKKPVGVIIQFSKITVDGLSVEGDITNVKLPKFPKRLVVEVNPVDGDGDAAAYQEGTLVFVSSDPEVATVTVDPDNERKAYVQRVEGALGEALITVKGDGDPDDYEVREITGTLAVVAALPEAVVFDLTATEEVVEEPTPDPAPVDENV